MRFVPVRFEVCALTADGHAAHEALGLPLNGRDLKFLSRRAGACIPDFPALLSCRARGLVEPTSETPHMVTWRRVSGLAHRRRPEEMETAGDTAALSKG